MQIILLKNWQSCGTFVWRFLRCIDGITFMKMYLILIIIQNKNIGKREKERVVLDSRDSKSIQFQRIYSPIKSNRVKNGAATISPYLQRSGFRVTEIVTVSSSDRKRVRTRTRGSCLSFRDRRRRAQRRVVTRQHELRNCPPIERLALTRETKRKRKRKKEWGRDEGLHEIYTYDKPDGLLTFAAASQARDTLRNILWLPIIVYS